MNGDGRLASARLRLPDPRRAYHGGTTPLQAATVALRDLVLDARDELDPVAYSWFVAIAAEVVGLEAARLFVGESLRVTRGERRRAA